MTDKKLLWLAVVTGIAAVICVEVYVRYAVGDPPEQVLFTTRDIAEGATFQDGDVRQEPVSKRPPGALTEKEKAYVRPASGVRTRRRIPAQSPICFADLATPGEIRLSDRIPEGMRALSLPVSRASSVTNMIHPEDRVEILVSGAGGSVEKVEGSYVVVAVGTRLTPGAQDLGSYDTVTLQVTPAEAQRIVTTLARSRGGAVTLILCGKKT